MVSCIWTLLMTPGLGSPICEWWLSSRTQTDSIDVTSDADHHDILPRWNRWCNSPGRGMYSPPPFPPPLSSLPQAQKHDPNVQMHMTPKTPHTQCRQMRCAHHCKYMLHSHLSFYSHFPPSLQTWEDVLWSPGPPHLHRRCAQTLHRFSRWVKDNPDHSWPDDGRGCCWWDRGWLEAHI